MVRIKHRYLLINLLYPERTQDLISKTTNTIKARLPDIVTFHRPSPQEFNEGLLKRLVENGVTELFGEYGSGIIAGSLKIMYLSNATSTAIIRVSREAFRVVWAALTFTTQLPRPLFTPCVINVIRVSGTIRKSEEAAIAFAKGVVKRAKEADEGGGRRLLGDLGRASMETGDGRGLGEVMDIDSDDSG